MVALDIAKVIAVIDHQAQALPYTFFGGIPEPVQPFEPRAVAEMEAGDPVERPAGAIFREEVIMRGGRKNRGPERVLFRLVLAPALLVDLLQQRPSPAR